MPKKVTEGQIRILHDAFKRALEDKEFQELADKLDLNREYLDGASCSEKIKRDFETIGALIKQLNLGNK